jgi:hypothetical protein
MYVEPSWRRYGVHSQIAALTGAAIGSVPVSCGRRRAFIFTSIEEWVEIGQDWASSTSMLAYFFALSCGEKRRPIYTFLIRVFLRGTLIFAVRRDCRVGDKLHGVRQRIQ